MADKINYTHGDVGSKPPDGNEFAANERPQAAYFDWYISTLVTKHNSVIDELDTIDSDNDGIVDEADTANLYKNNDIDSNGDGKVDSADTADYANDADASTYKGTDIDTDGDGTVNNSDKYDGVAPTDGTADQVLTTNGTSASWQDNYEGFTYTDGSNTTCIKTGENRFASEGTSTTATSYTTIAASDLVFNPDDYKDSSGEVYVRLIYHIKHSTNTGNVSIRLYRQNAASPVDGTNTNVETTEQTLSLNDSWGIADTGWVRLSGDTGFESYQIQIRSGDGYSVSYNSVSIWFGQPT